MSEPYVLESERATLRLLTLNRPEDRNPLDPGMASALRDAVAAAMEDDAVRSVAIAANGPAFCAGGDLRQMRDLATTPGEQAYAWPAAIVDLHQLALKAPKPLVAVIDGPAVAGGMGLAGMCDVVLATKRARFATPEVRMGLFPMIIVAPLARSLPRKLLLDLMLTGRSIDAEEARQAGFVNRVCDDEADLLAALDQYASWFAETSPNAVRLGRRAFEILADMPASQALDAAQFLNVTFFLGSDLAEGASAFLDKRPPRWVTAQDQEENHG